MTQEGNVGPPSENRYCSKGEKTHHEKIYATKIAPGTMPACGGSATMKANISVADEVPSA